MMRKYLATIMAPAVLPTAGTAPAMARRYHRADPRAGRQLYLYAPGGLGSSNALRPGLSDDLAFTGGGSAGYNDFTRRNQP